ncbi:stage II sporulation protein P [Paenibacillaceae bacterium WGS1546]|uniref:stage II sporulation protein P n=1 Tax=Cohnella sp. WGS1546 TaxID=3366810 RepID=UPI00372D208C
MFARTSIMGLFVVMLLFAAATPAYGTYAEPIKGTVVKFSDVTNLRSGPGLEYEILGKAKPGESYPVVGLDGEWLLVPLTEEQTAYVAGWVVETAAPSVVHFVDVTNLRSGPGLEHEIVGKAQAGESIPIAGGAGEWYEIELDNGDAAYVASWVVETDLDRRSPPEVYIYHTHNRESWKGVARHTKGSSVDDPSVNITLVGKHLGEKLQERGIPSLVEQTDFTERLKEKKLGFGSSYSESRKAVVKAQETYPSLAYFFDIHRDANVSRKNITVDIGGKAHAKVLFVIGTAHPNHAKNKKLANELSERLNKKYPGISRGVIAKSAHQGNGEYNQSLSPGSLLLEIGSENSTLEESLRTAEAIADVFSDYLQSIQ